MNDKKQLFWGKMTGVLLLVLILFIGVVAHFADEGMWTFDNPPIQLLGNLYGFTPTQEWLDHVRLSSVRFMDGGSGSFVSPDGLVLTNHHVAVGQLQKISTPEMDYVTSGFYAETPDEELKCADLEVNVLVYMENVTDRVIAAISEGMSEEEALKAREAVIAKIEKESLEETGLRSNVIDLYHGGEYWLYRYRKYTDVRLVMAPERQAAYFGGDYDNFTYPRYDLDMAFFRVYENDKPIRSNNYFKWNAEGAGDGELVFVSGNPGSSDRLFTYAQLEYLRDSYYPLVLNYIDKRLSVLREFMQEGPEQERKALVQIFGLENSKKALTGEYESLLDKNLIEKKRKDEETFRQLVDSNPEWQRFYGDAWETIMKVTRVQSESATRRFYYQIRGSNLATIASDLVFYTKEIKKPDSERLEGYHDSQLDEFKFNLFSPAPIYYDLEEANLTGYLSLAMEELGPEDDFMQLVLNGRTPEEVSQELIQGTKLADVSLREALFEGGEKAIEACQDPMIKFMKKLEPVLRDNIEWNKKNIESILTLAQEKIAKARFAIYGKEAYPDATFTLRLTYGAVKGYPMNGTKAPYKTTLYGLFDRALSFNREIDFDLPERFWERQDQMDLSTPVNFVSTCDVLGGNSGSPVINANAEIVGVIFDGNIESLGGTFVFDETKNRAVAVHTGYITEALRKLYDAGKLMNEIEGK
ncbi:S46 family peptidase [bacterium]|nr:S46 family peptidase [bacterium]RQV98959.1 MAG: S46 family peptidase [bacterium]